MSATIPSISIRKNSPRSFWTITSLTDAMVDSYGLILNRKYHISLFFASDRRYKNPRRNVGGDGGSLALARAISFSLQARQPTAGAVQELVGSIFKNLFFERSASMLHIA